MFILIIYYMTILVYLDAPDYISGIGSLCGLAFVLDRKILIWALNYIVILIMKNTFCKDADLKEDRGHKFAEKQSVLSGFFL